MSKKPIPSKYRAAHYSTKLFKAQYLYLAKYYDKSFFTDTCESLGVPIEYILKDDNWVSNEFLGDLFGKLIELTGEEKLAENMGRFAIDPQSANHIEYSINKAVLFPALFYLAAPKQYNRYNNINRFRLARWRFGLAEYIMRPKGKVVSLPYVCDNTVGFLSGTGVLFDLDSINVTHPRCIHRGDSSCHFIVRYKAKRFWMKRLRSLLILLFGGGISIYVSKLLGSQAGALVGVAYLCSVIAIYSSKRYFSLSRHIQQYNDQSRKKSTELYENYVRLDRKYNESKLLRNLSLKLSESENTRKILQMCLDELANTFGYPRAMIMLLSSDKKHLYTTEARGFEGDGEKLYGLNLQYPAPKNHPHLFANILSTGSAEIIKNIRQYREKLKPQNQQLVDLLGVQSIVAAPIQDKEHKYGLLVVGALEEDEKLGEEDKALIDNISKLLSISSQRASDFEKEKQLRTVFQKYVPPIVLEGLHSLKNSQSAELTSIFIDLRDFTKRCENLRPEKVVELVTLYSEYVTKRLAKMGGVIDKLNGDGINAFFPVNKKKQVNHARQALYAGLSILAELEELDEEFQKRGFGSARLGIGIHSGIATLGNMGSNERLGYTAVGDVVNLAARLEELSKKFFDDDKKTHAGVLVLTEDTLKAAKLLISTKKFENIPIRGRGQNITVYTIHESDARSWWKSGKSIAIPSKLSPKSKSKKAA